MEEIVKTAGISKGSLFYYFESKKNFFIYLYEHCGKQFEKIVDNPGPDGVPAYMAYTDFFERLNAIQLLKMKATSQYPQMTGFLKKIIFDTSSIAQEVITDINNRYSRERAMIFFRGLDYYKFKEGIEPMMVIQLLTWCSEGCASQGLLEEQVKPAAERTAPDFNKIVELYMKYVRMFHNNFYKEEYL
jgi:AcrR family transcriptional regulator